MAKIKIPESLTSNSFSPQEERLEVMHKSEKLFIAIPKESSFQENRVALTPDSVATLIAYGHRVVIEDQAGVKCHYSNHDYSEAGAEIAFDKEQVFKAQVILKVAPPTKEEIDLLVPNQIVISPIHLPTIDEEYINKLRQKRVIAFAWEYIRDNSGAFPFVRTLSEMAGITSMLTAAELLSNAGGGRGVLLGGISGVPSTKVVIIGAGVVAEYATRTALGLGAEVRIFDNNIYKLMRIQRHLSRQLYTSAINPKILEEELLTADVVIGAIHSKEGRTPVIISEEMVASMKKGAVIIDVSIDQGGCFATSRITTHDKPTFVKHGVIHYCVPNLAARVAQTASVAISNILTPLLLHQQAGDIDRMLYSQQGLRQGVYCYKGCLTNVHLSERFNVKYTNLDLLLTSSR